MTPKTEKEALLAVANEAEWWAWAERQPCSPCFRCRAMIKANLTCSECKAFKGTPRKLACFEDYGDRKTAAIASLVRAGIEKPKEGEDV